MSDKSQQEELLAWAEAYREFDLTAWERLPDIDLYMDQVIGYLGRMLCLQERCDGAPLLTASMVNNYVKAGYIPRPNQKKYGREHLAALYILCSAKQTLSVADAAALLSMLHGPCPADALYTLFGQRQREIAEEVTEPLLTAKEKPSSEELLNLALDLTLRASACHLVAERILDDLKREQAEKEEAKRKEEEDAAARRRAEEAEAKRLADEAAAKKKAEAAEAKKQAEEARRAEEKAAEEKKKAEEAEAKKKKEKAKE